MFPEWKKMRLIGSTKQICVLARASEFQSLTRTIQRKVGQ